MKASSNPRALDVGDVLFAKDKAFLVCTTKTRSAPACMHCCFRNDSCGEYVGAFCPSNRFYVPAEPTPEIDHAISLALLKGEIDHAVPQKQNDTAAAG